MGARGLMVATARMDDGLWKSQWHDCTSTLLLLRFPSNFLLLAAMKNFDTNKVCKLTINTDKHF
jgi:hypothetical protein